jgi:hypothetical protein
MSILPVKTWKFPAWKWLRKQLQSDKEYARPKVAGYILYLK